MLLLINTFSIMKFLYTEVSRNGVHKAVDIRNALLARPGKVFLL